jgi:hypothetical protein
MSWRKLHGEEHRNLYSWPSIIQLSQGGKDGRHVAQVGEDIGGKARRT